MFKRHLVLAGSIKWKRIIKDEINHTGYTSENQNPSRGLVMETEWTRVIGRMAFGIYVLTTAADQVINGMIASRVSMVSFDPPLLIVADAPQSIFPQAH